MSVMFPCPKCGRKLSAPDASAGKQIRCPAFGCDSLAQVPAFTQAEEVEVVEAQIAPQESAPDEEETVERSPKRSSRSKREIECEEERRSRPKRPRGEEDLKIQKKRRRHSHYEDELTLKRVTAGGLSSGAVAAITIGGIVLLCGIGFGIYAILGKKDNTSGPSGSVTGARSASRPAGFVTRANGSIEAEQVVDAAWSSLLGKWEVFPNPQDSAVWEFSPDYIARRVSNRGATQDRTATIIEDRTGITLGMGAIKPGDRHYLITFQTAPKSFEQIPFNLFADGTLAEGMYKRTFYHRTGATKPDGSSNPSMEETILRLLLGKKWGENIPGGTRIEFGTDRSIHSKVIKNKIEVTVEGKINGIRLKPTGFVLLLGTHTKNGNTSSNGELGEFYYLGESLYLTFPDSGGYIDLAHIP